MKKIFRISVICVLALVSITGCRKETFRPGDRIVFRAGTVDRNTRAAYSGEMTDGYERIDWATGDLLRIWCDEASEPASHYADYKTNGGTKSGKQSLSFMSAAGGSSLMWGEGVHNFYAVYPSPSAGGAVTAMDTEAICATTPASQTVTAGEPADGNWKTTADLSKSMVMVANSTIAAEDYEKGGVLLEFAPLTTVLEFTITNSTGADLDVASVYLTSATHPLSGNWAAYIGVNGEDGYANCAFTSALDASTRKASVTPDKAVKVADGKTLTFDIFLCPQDNVDDLIFHIASSDGKERYTKLEKASGKVTFKKHLKTYVSGLFVPAGAVWQVSYDPSLDSWDSEDFGGIDLTNPNLNLGDLFVTSWSEGIVDDADFVMNDGSCEPLCFYAESEQSVTFEKIYRNGDWGFYTTNADAVLYYSYDTSTWTRWSNTLEPLYFGNNEHPSIYIRGNNPDGFGNGGTFRTTYDADNSWFDYWTTIDWDTYHTFKFGNSDGVAVSGNIMSLFGDSVTAGRMPFDAEFAFGRLFYDAPVIYASALALPAYELTPYAYAEMFCYCNDLLTPPALPATTLAEGCYYKMFYGCYDLSYAPALPARHLKAHCYASMFEECSLIRTAPNLNIETVADGCCHLMFRYCSSLGDGPEVLQATTLAPFCYAQMFKYCNRLKKAPELPATNLAEGCYAEMFYDCYSISTPPILPATTLAKKCYSSMFMDCERLAKAPVLPATEMAPHCYEHMLHGCPIQTAPELPAMKLAPHCYDGMFEECDAITVAPALPATQLAEGCYHYMFTYCDKIERCPELPATVLAPRCYDSMFEYSDGVRFAPEILPATELAESCYSHMFDQCDNLETVPQLPATKMAKDCYSSMFSSCDKLTETPALPATELAYGCYNNMFSYCPSLVSAPEVLPATTLADHCYQSMFSQCSSLQTAPELPATKLVSCCYFDMFYNCSSLNYVKMLAEENISAYNCLNNWLSGVSGTGTFVKKAGVELPEGASGIPYGWAVEEVTE